MVWPQDYRTAANPGNAISTTHRTGFTHYYPEPQAIDLNSPSTLTGQKRRAVPFIARYHSLRDQELQLTLNFDRFEECLKCIKDENQEKCQPKQPTVRATPGYMSVRKAGSYNFSTNSCSCVQSFRV